MDIDVLAERLTQIERRTEANDTFRHQLRESMEGVKRDMAVMNSQLRNLAEDQEKDRLTRKARDESLRSWLIGATGVFIAFTGVLVTLLVSRGGM